MKHARRPTRRNESPRRFCNVCGKPSEHTICEERSERIRMETLWRKKREEQGDAWSPWK
jgi:hypothetical protein